MKTRIDTVAVLGTGVLGSQIAYQTAYSGFDVTAYYISDEILEKSKNYFVDMSGRSRGIRRLSPGRPDEDHVLVETR